MNEEAREVGQLYPAVYHRFQASRQAIKGTGVTPRMVGLLRHLAGSGPLTLGELVTHLGLSKSAVTELVDRVEAKGLTSRIRDDRDRRKVFLWLTDQGRQVVSETVTVLEEEKLGLALGRMTPEERKNLITGLRALLRADQEVQDGIDGEVC